MVKASPLGALYLTDCTVEVELLENRFNSIISKRGLATCSLRKPKRRDNRVKPFFMADNKYYEKTFQTPNEFADVHLRDYTGAETKVMVILTRKTYGWFKDADDVANSQMMEFTGLSRQAIKEAVESLIARGHTDLLNSGGGRQMNRYARPYIERDENLPGKLVTRSEITPQGVDNLTEKAIGGVTNLPHKTPLKPTTQNPAVVAALTSLDGKPLMQILKSKKPIQPHLPFLDLQGWDSRGATFVYRGKADALAIQSVIAEQGVPCKVFKGIV